MYNRYVGNTGKRYRVEERPHVPPQPMAAPLAASIPPIQKPPARPTGGLGGLLNFGGPGGLGSLFNFGGPGGLGSLFNFGGPGGLSGMFKSMMPSLPFGMDAGDLMLLLLLFFLYTESGDEEFLIILAVIGFSIFKNR